MGNWCESAPGDIFGRSAKVVPLDVLGDQQPCNVNMPIDYAMGIGRLLLDNPYNSDEENRASVAELIERRESGEDVVIPEDQDEIGFDPMGSFGLAESGTTLMEFAKQIKSASELIGNIGKGRVAAICGDELYPKTGGKELQVHLQRGVWKGF